MNKLGAAHMKTLIALIFLLAVTPAWAGHWHKVGTTKDDSETLYYNPVPVNCYRSGVCTYWFLMKFSTIQNDAKQVAEQLNTPAGDETPDYNESMELIPIYCKGYSMGHDYKTKELLNGKVVQSFTDDLDVLPDDFDFLGDLVESPNTMYGEIDAVCGSYSD